MSLPLTITGLSTANNSIVGPFRSSGGNYYLFGIDGTTGTTLQAYKATNPASSWSSIDSQPGYSTQINFCRARRVDDVVHLIVCDGTSSGANYNYLTFDMASDAFVITEVIASALNTDSQFTCDISIRSAGEVVVIFDGQRAKIGSNYFGRVYYSRRTGTDTWSSPAEIDDGGSDTYYWAAMAMGASDRCHFFYYAGGLQEQKTLTSANVLQSVKYGDIHPATSPQTISFDISGTTKVIAVGASAWLNYFDSADNPTLGATAVVGWRLYYDSGSQIVYILDWADITHLKIRSSSDYGASWSASSTVYTPDGNSPHSNGLSVNGEFYARGGDYVVPYIILDGAALKYNEYVARSANVSVSLAGAKSTSAIATAARTLTKVFDSVLTSAAQAGAGPKVSKTQTSGNAAARTNSLLASGGAVSPSLVSISSPAGSGSWGFSISGAGGSSSLNVTRLGPGGYPIAALPGGPGVPTENITLFSADSTAAPGTLVNYELSFTVPAATSAAATGLAIWKNSRPLSSVLGRSNFASFGCTIDTASLPSANTTAAQAAFGIASVYRLATIAATSAPATDPVTPELIPAFESILTTAAVGELSPYAFSGTSVVLNSIAAQAVTSTVTPANEIILPETVASAATNILRMEGDEALSLAAAAASGTVGDLLVAIVIPAAIKWLVCASIDIVPEVAGDLAMNAELQATVIAATALQGSPQIAVEVGGILEITPIVGGTPSMKEC